MRLAFACAVALAVLAGPSPALAFDCASHCSGVVAKCKSNCAGEKNGKDCLKKCEVQDKLCLPTCNISQRNKNNPERAEQEMRT